MIRIELGIMFSRQDDLSAVCARIVESGYTSHDLKGLFPRIEFYSESKTPTKLESMFTAEEIQYYRHICIYITETSDE